MRFFYSKAKIQREYFFRSVAIFTFRTATTFYRFLFLFFQSTLLPSNILDLQLRQHKKKNTLPVFHFLVEPVSKFCWKCKQRDHDSNHQLSGEQLGPTDCFHRLSPLPDRKQYSRFVTVREKECGQMFLVQESFSSAVQTLHKTILCHDLLTLKLTW